MEKPCTFQGRHGWCVLLERLDRSRLFGSVSFPNWNQIVSRHGLGVTFQLVWAGRSGPRPAPGGYGTLAPSATASPSRRQCIVCCRCPRSEAVSIKGLPLRWLGQARTQSESSAVRPGRTVFFHEKRQGTAQTTCRLKPVQQCSGLWL